MGRKELGSVGVHLNVNRNGPGSFEVRSHVWDDCSCIFLFGADNLGPEIGSGYERLVPVPADSRCVYEVSFRLSKRWDEGEDFRGKAIDGCE